MEELDWKLSLVVELDFLEEEVAVVLAPLEEEEEEVLDHVMALEILGEVEWARMDLDLAEVAAERLLEEAVFPSSLAPFPYSLVERRRSRDVSSRSVVELVLAPRQPL